MVKNKLSLSFQAKLVAIYKSSLSGETVLALVVSCRNLLGPHFPSPEKAQMHVNIWVRGYLNAVLYAEK